MANDSSPVPHTLATTVDFLYPTPTKEDLPRLARLAYELSTRHCDGCRDYHAMWPLLRSLGCNGGGPEYCWPLQRAAVAEAIAGRSSARWLLGGSADAGQLALVGDVIAGQDGATHWVTAVDRCLTPLELCRAHADAHALPLHTVNAELASFTADGTFDVVLLHHVLSHIPSGERPAFFARVRGWLAPGGQVLVWTSYRTSESRTPSLSQVLRTWRESVIRSAAARGSFQPPEDIDRLVARIDGMRETGGRVRSGGHALDYFTGLITGAGLSVVRIIDLPFDDAERALHGDPRPRCVIVATR
jgi:hypothetical protein